MILSINLFSCPFTKCVKSDSWYDIPKMKAPKEEGTQRWRPHAKTNTTPDESHHSSPKENWTFDCTEYNQFSNRQHLRADMQDASQPVVTFDFLSTKELREPRLIKYANLFHDAPLKTIIRTDYGTSGVAESSWLQLYLESATNNLRPPFIEL